MLLSLISISVFFCNLSNNLGLLLGLIKRILNSQILCCDLGHRIRHQVSNEKLPVTEFAYFSSVFFFVDLLTLIGNFLLIVLASKLSRLGQTSLAIWEAAKVTARVFQFWHFLERFLARVALWGVFGLCTGLGLRHEENWVVLIKSELSRLNVELFARSKDVGHACGVWWLMRLRKQAFRWILAHLLHYLALSSSPFKGSLEVILRTDKSRQILHFLLLFRTCADHTYQIKIRLDSNWNDVDKYNHTRWKAKDLLLPLASSFWITEKA